MNMILLGPPGAGKGTMAEQITAKFNVEHLSTGDLFRYNIGNKTALGQLAKSYIDKGELVPDSVTCDMVEEKIASLPQEQGFLLDGFPRNLAQAEALQKILAKLNRRLTLVINIKLDDNLIVSRLEGRRVCKSCGASFHVVNRIPAVEGVCDNCGGELIHRSDDKAEVIANRLAVYHSSTSPLIEYYSKMNLVYDLDNSGSMRDSVAKLSQKLETLA